MNFRNWTHVHKAVAAFGEISGIVFIPVACIGVLAGRKEIAEYGAVCKRTIPCGEVFANFLQLIQGEFLCLKCREQRASLT